MRHPIPFIVTSATLWHIILAYVANTTTKNDTSTVYGTSDILPTKTGGLQGDDEAKRCYDSYANLRYTGPPVWELCDPPRTLAASDLEPYSATSTMLTIQTFAPGATYKACDGIPRFKFSPNGIPTTTASTITMVHRGWTPGIWRATCTRTLEPPYPGCTVAPNYCDSLWKSYSSKIPTFSETAPFEVPPGKPFHPCDGPEVCFIDVNVDAVLLYWPPNLESRNVCAADELDFGRTMPSYSSPTVTTITEIKFPGKNSYSLAWETITEHDPRIEPSVLTGSWIVTSPDILLAHRPMVLTSYTHEPGRGEFGDAIRTVSTLRSAGIITLQPQDVYSRTEPVFRTKGGIDEARMMANGSWRLAADRLVTGWLNFPVQTVPVNFAHLQNPVPASIYFGAESQCWGEQTHCGTIIDDSYRFKMEIASRVWRTLVPEHQFCMKPDLIVSPMILSAGASQNLATATRKPTSAYTTPASPSRQYGLVSGPQPTTEPPNPAPRPFSRKGPMSTSKLSSATDSAKPTPLRGV
jgi:hypothetical protein